MEMSMAFIALQFASSYLKKKSGQPFELSDFVLYAEQKEKSVGSPEEVFGLLSALAQKDES